jgi:hypothetical protein
LLDHSCNLVFKAYNLEFLFVISDCQLIDITRYQETNLVYLVWLRAQNYAFSKAHHCLILGQSSVPRQVTRTRSPDSLLKFLEEASQVPPVPQAGGTNIMSVIIHKPDEPIMGGLAQTDLEKLCAWTGGHPNIGWTAFEVPIADYETPNQLRSAYDVKGFHHCKKGITLKFNKSDMLIPFKKLVWNHLKDSGLDTITYLPDLHQEMSNVIYDHSRYTLDSARKLSAVQVALYDKYDKTNDTAATAFLLDSLSPALSTVINERLEDSDSFSVVWLELMNEIQVQTIEWIEAIKAKIKSRCPQQYPGQDLEKMAVDFRADALELVNAGQYEHNLTLTMLKSHLQAGGINNEDYRFGLRLLKIKLDQ